MARASELLLIVRAQNQASAALRRVAGDLRGLSAMSDLRRRGESLQLGRNQLMMQRQRNINELKSITNGQRMLALEKARVSQSLTSQRNALRMTGEGQRALRLQEAGLANQREASRLGRQARRYAETGITGPVLRENQLAMEQNAIAAQRLAAEQGRLSASTRVAVAEIEKEAIAVAQLEAREAGLIAREAELVASNEQIGHKLRVFNQDIAENNKAIRQMPYERISRVGSAFQHTARIMEYGGLVLGAGLGIMAKNAADFSQNVTLAATQTRSLGAPLSQTADHAKILERTILDLSKQFPQSVDDMSKAAYDLYSSTSVGFGRGQKLMKTFAQAAVAGQTDIQTATSAGITVLNNFQQSVDRMPQLMQRMFAAVRFGRMTFQDFATSMSTLGPAARASNQSFTEMAGTFAFLTRHLRVSYARVGYARVLEALATPKMITGLHKVGVEVQNANHQLLPLHQIIGQIIQRFPQLQKGGTDAMNFFKNIGGDKGTIQARRAFTFLVQFFNRAGKDGASYLSMLRQVAGDQDEFTKSFEAMAKTPGVRWKVFVNQMKALAIEIGQNVIPAVEKMAGPLQRVVHWWENLSDTTKASIASFATWTAAFLLVGGAVVFVGGTFIKLFGIFGKFVGWEGVLVGTFIAVNAAVALLTGNMHSLSSILDQIANFTFSSWQNAAITFGVITAGAIKLTGALRGLAEVSAVEGAVGRGGLLAGLIGSGRAARTGFQVGREVEGLKGGLSLAASEAGVFASRIAPVAAIVAVVAGGLATWKMAMADAAREAKKFQDLKDLGLAPIKQGDIFQQIGLGQEGFERADIRIRQIKRGIADLRDQLKVAKTGRQKAGIIDDIRLGELDLVDAEKQRAQALQKVNKEFDAFTGQITALGAVKNRAKELRTEIDQVQQKLRGEHVTPVRATAYLAQLQDLQKQLKTLEDAGNRSFGSLQKGFNTAVRNLAKIGKIPMPSAKALGDMLQLALRKGRALTIPEMKAVIKAEVDPSSIRNLPRKLQSQIRTAIKLRVEADVSGGAAALGGLAGKLQGGQRKLKITATADTKAATQAFNKLTAPVNKSVNIKPSQDPVQIGINIANGISAGLNSVDLSVTVNQHINKFIDTYHKAAHGGSPYMLFAEKVGKPIVQGIAVGVLQNAGLLEKAATASITFFESAAIQKAQEAKKKITDALLIKDISLQASTLAKFNRSIARLSRRHVPRELIDQFAQLGPAAADLISQVSRMSEKELRKYVQMWKRANQSVKNSFRSNTEDIKAAAKQMHDDLKSKLLDMYTSLRDTTASQFGDLFAGIDPSTYGEGLKQAQADYANQVKDFQGQIKDLNQQIVDAQQEASQRLIDAIAQRKDDLQQAFGQLFGGDWLSGVEVQTKLDWGAKLGFDDLQKDLESQVTKFNRWRADLTSLAAKVPPELAKQLEALGPDAVDKLDVLNNATDDQLKQYVGTWQEGQSAIAAVADQTTVDTSDITARIADLVGQIAGVVAQVNALQVPHPLTAADVIGDLQAQIDQWKLYQGSLDDLAAKYKDITGQDLPAGLLEQLQQMGPQAIPFIQALLTGTDKQLTDYAQMWTDKEDLIEKATLDHLNRQLTLWFDYGANIGANIVAGVTSQGAALSDYFEQLITSLLQKIKLPVPKLGTGGVVNRPGLFQLADTGPEAVIPLDPWMKNLQGKTSGNGGNGTVNITQNVYAVQDESLDTTLNRAAFRILTQVPG